MIDRLIYEETRVYYLRALMPLFGLVLVIPLVLSLPNLRYNSYFEGWQASASSFVLYFGLTVAIVIFVQLNYKFWITTESISCFFLLFMFLISFGVSINALFAFAGSRNGSSVFFLFFVDFCFSLLLLTWQDYVDRKLW